MEFSYVARDVSNWGGHGFFFLAGARGGSYHCIRFGLFLLAGDFNPVVCLDAGLWGWGCILGGGGVLPLGFCCFGLFLCLGLKCYDSLDGLWGGVDLSPMDSTEKETWLEPLWRSEIAFLVAATSAASPETWQERLSIVGIPTTRLSLFEGSWDTALPQMWL